MTKPWRTIRDQRSKLSPSRRASVDEAVAREALELSLRDLREECGFTQQQMADALEMAQGAFSKLERRDDHLMSTLRRVVRALGGDLEVTARFPDKLVRLS
jgi:DNA-binding XRE family transcriptional regulator